MRLFGTRADEERTKVLFRPGDERQRAALAAHDPLFFQRCLDGELGLEMQPIGQYELLFRAMAKLEERIALLERDRDETGLRTNVRVDL